MTENGISQQVTAFLADHIDSVLELEVLLLLRASSPQPCSADDLVSTLKIDRAWAAQQLEKFATRGILARSDAPTPAYTYAPANAELDDTIRAVADAYTTHRVRIVSLIFSKPTSNLKSFADAFRIRKDPTDG